MSEEQNTPTEEAQDTNKVSFGDSTLQSAEENEKNKDDDNYYEVDKPKKELVTSIGDGEMRNEGTVGMGDIPDDTLLLTKGETDEQDKAELRDRGE